MTSEKELLCVFMSFKPLDVLYFLDLIVIYNIFKLEMKCKEFFKIDSQTTSK